MPDLAEVDRCAGGRPPGTLPGCIAAQVAGAVLGVLLALMMYPVTSELPD